MDWGGSGVFLFSGLGCQKREKNYMCEFQDIICSYDKRDSLEEYVDCIIPAIIEAHRKHKIIAELISYDHED